MTSKVNREALLHCLDCVEPGLSPREILEQSSCFVLQSGSVETFNDEVYCRATTGLDKAITGAVQAKPLQELLRRMPEEEIEVKQSEGELLIVGKRRRAGLRLEEEITLPVKNVEKPTEWNKLHEDFTDAIGIVQQCASTDESQFSLTCVHIHPKWLEACDNFQLCRWKLKTGLKQSTLVRQLGIRHITKLGMTEFSETEGWVHFRNPKGIYLSCRRYLEEFPDLSVLLDVEGDSAQLPKGLGEAANIAHEVFTKENPDSNLILVDLKPGKVQVEGRGSSGWYRQSAKVKYAGKPLSFRISPLMLIDLVKRHNECVISPDRLKVDGGTYLFVSCLSKVEENSNGQSDEVTEE